MSEQTPTEAWATTYDGNSVNILNPTKEAVHLYDIVTSLARKPRYNGFIDCDIDDLYTVAQHAVYVSRLTGNSPMDRLVGLVHDNPEYILMDVITPFKRVLPDYRKVEGMWEPFMYEWIGAEATPERLARMHAADQYVLKMEMHEFGRDWGDSSSYPKLFDFFKGHRIMKPSEARLFYLNELTSIVLQLPEWDMFEELSDCIDRCHDRQQMTA